MMGRIKEWSDTLAYIVVTSLSAAFIITNYTTGHEAISTILITLAVIISLTLTITWTALHFFKLIKKIVEELKK